jgi:hypothetical protein
MRNLILPARAVTLAAAVAAIFAVGGAAPAKADAPFCVENYSRVGPGRMCSFYTYEACVAYTSGIGGSCSANAWYRPYEPAPRRHRARRHHHG